LHQWGGMPGSPNPAARGPVFYTRVICVVLFLTKNRP
jgi:hypothetical protein